MSKRILCAPDSFKGSLSAATKAYLEEEKVLQKTPGAETCLVAAESLDELKRAYPNYFLDTDLFLAQVRSAIGE